MKYFIAIDMADKDPKPMALYRMGDDGNDPGWFNPKSKLWEFSTTPISATGIGGDSLIREVNASKASGAQKYLIEKFR